MSRDVCPCVVCQTDRENGRRQYVARWADGMFYSATGRFFEVPRKRAGVFGVRHAAWLGPHLALVLVAGKRRDGLTIAKCRASKDPATMPAVF